jgi:hypothetical protein
LSQALQFIQHIGHRQAACPRKFRVVLLDDFKVLAVVVGFR